MNPTPRASVYAPSSSAAFDPTSAASHVDAIRVGLPEVQRRDGGGTLRFPLAMEGEDRELWYSVEGVSVEAFAADRLDAALVGMLPAAMATGRPLVLEGPVSERLFHNVTRHWAPIAKAIVAEFEETAVAAHSLTRDRRDATGVVTGFSAGVDSFAVLADHHFSPAVPEGYRLTHLLMNNVGSHGAGGRAVFQERLQRLRPVADAMGLPLISVDSNLHELLPIGFIPTHAARNASVALALQGLVRTFLYASSYSYDATFIGPARGMGHADPAAIHLLSTEGMEAQLSGAAYTRVEKTALVAELEIARANLDVCVSPMDARVRPNCSRCWKCMRTQLTLEVLGELEAFSEVFDLDRYAQLRDEYLGRALVNRDDRFLREIASEIRARRHPVSLEARMHGARRWVLDRIGQ